MLVEELIEDLFKEALEDVEYAKLLAYIEELYPNE